MGWFSDIVDYACELLHISRLPEPGPSAKQVQICPEPDPVVVDVGFLDSPANPAYFGGIRKQYVNFDNHSDDEKGQVIATDTEIKSVYQLGRAPAIKVRLNQKRMCGVRVRLIAEKVGTHTPTLSDREKGLFPWRWQDTEVTGMTDGNGELIWAPGGLQLPVQAGMRYYVEAAVTGQAFKRSANAVDVYRRVYIQPMSHYAKGLHTALTAMSEVTSEVVPYSLEVKVLPEMSSDEWGVVLEQSLPKTLNLMGADILAGPKVKPLSPHVVAVILGQFVSDDATPQTFSFYLRKAAFDDGKYPTSFRIALKDSGLFYRLLPLDGGKAFVSGSIDGASGTNYEIKASEVTDTSNFVGRLTVDLSNLPQDVLDEEGFYISLNVYAMSSWGVGWAYNSYPVIYLNMRDAGSFTDALLNGDMAMSLMLHELGHKLHLTSSGAGTLPDKQPHYYPTWSEPHNGMVHQGPHCSTGVTTPNTWDPGAHDAASCNMWGALKPTKIYCSECAATLLKVDLAGGF